MNLSTHVEPDDSSTFAGPQKHEEYRHDRPDVTTAASGSGGGKNISPIGTKQRATATKKGVRSAAKGKRWTWKKPKGTPKSPLSSYNFFFQHERKKKLEDSEGRTPLGFEDMAKEIAKKWSLLDDSSRSVFEALASADKRRYNEEIIQWNGEQQAKQGEQRGEEGLPQHSAGQAVHKESKPAAIIASVNLSSSVHPTALMGQASATPNDDVKSGPISPDAVTSNFEKLNRIYGAQVTRVQQAQKVNQRNISKKATRFLPPAYSTAETANQCAEMDSDEEFLSLIDSLPRTAGIEDHHLDFHSSGDELCLSGTCFKDCKDESTSETKMGKPSTSTSDEKVNDSGILREPLDNEDATCFPQEQTLFTPRMA